MNEENNRFLAFQERFKALRETLNMKQADFAEYIGISRPTVGFYENGERVPDALTLKKICETCGCTSDYLLGFDEAPTRAVSDVCKETGLPEQSVKTLGYWTVLARLHDKRTQLTDDIISNERLLIDTRNDNPREEDIIKTLSEQDRLKIERDSLDQEMLELVDPGEGYFRPPQWLAPIICQRARQKLDALALLITNENGEKALNEIGEYFYMGNLADGIIRAENETLGQRISNEDIAKIKLFNVQDNLHRVREELISEKQRSKR